MRYHGIFDVVGIRRRVLVVLAGSSALLLQACGGGDQGGSGGGSGTSSSTSSNAVASVAQASSLSSALSILVAKYPTVVDASSVNRLSLYQQTQLQALPALGGPNSIFEGEWNKAYRLSGYCYVIQYTALNRICSVAGAPTQPIGRYRFTSTSASAGSGGTVVATDLSNGLVLQGEFKVFYAFKAATVETSNTRSLPFALVVVGDIYQANSYYYSTLLVFEGTAAFSQINGNWKILCGPQNDKSVRPTIGFRYRQYVLNGVNPPPGVPLDYDASISPSGSSTVPIAPASC